MTPVGCAACGATWLGAEAGAACPGCGAAELGPSARPIRGEPERFVPFALSRDAVLDRLAAWGAEVRHACDGLAREALDRTLRPVWWPLWLVDAHARGRWEAEAGFDYEVTSSVERYGAGGWNTEEVTETRIRWEPRAGAIDRAVPDLPVPALADHALRVARLGPPQVARSQPWDPDAATPAPIRLPDRTPEEQWPAAVAALRRVVGEDCARAAGAQHIRDVRLEIDADQADWTWLLLPGWTAWYLDDDGVRHVLWADGATGAVAGPRMASPAKGRRAALGLAVLAAVLAAIAVVIGVVGIVLLPLLAVAAFLLLLAFVFAALAIPAALGPARHNRAEADAAVSDPRA